MVATSGDTGGAAVEAFRGRTQVDLVVLFPNGRISDVQRRMMTCADDANVHALAIDGTFDDCQAIVKAMFNHHAFRDRVGLSGVNSINFARIAAQVVYYFVAAVALGAPHRKVAFTVPTGNFGDVFAGYVAAQMGLPIERLTVATNVNDILVRTLATGTYEVRDVVATASPSMDIQVSSNFERLLFEAYGRDPKPVRAAMASLAQSRRFSIAAPALAAMRAGVHGRSRQRGRDRRGDPHHVARDRHHDRPAHRRRDRGRREGDARSDGADGRAVDRACGEISRRGRGGLRRAAAAAGLARRSRPAHGARHRAAGRSGGGRALRSRSQSRRARRSSRMSVEVTRLPPASSSSPTRCRISQTASLGVWVGCGSRDEQADEHGISHFLEHMAFKGTTRRTARQIAEEIEAVGGDLNAATGVEMTAYYARVLRPTCRSRSTSCPTS